MQTAGTNFRVSPAGVLTILRTYAAEFEETSIAAELPAGGLTLGPVGSLDGTTTGDGLHSLGAVSELANAAR